MYSVDEIKQLLAAFDNSKATRLTIKNGEGDEISFMQKSSASAITEQTVINEPVVERPQVKTSNSPFIQPEEKQADDGSSPVNSPMVGVFYAAPAPDKDPYVSVGSVVSKGDVLCLIEAMKLMNEVTADKGGTITKICVENGDVVEYGQPLFMIK